MQIELINREIGADGWVGGDSDDDLVVGGDETRSIVEPMGLSVLEVGSGRLVASNNDVAVASGEEGDFPEIVGRSGEVSLELDSTESLVNLSSDWGAEGEGSDEEVGTSRIGVRGGGEVKDVLISQYLISPLVGLLEGLSVGSSSDVSDLSLPSLDGEGSGHLGDWDEVSSDNSGWGGGSSDGEVVGVVVNSVEVRVGGSSSLVEVLSSSCDSGENISDGGGVGVSVDRGSGGVGDIVDDGRLNVEARVVSIVEVDEVVGGDGWVSELEESGSLEGVGLSWNDASGSELSDSGSWGRGQRSSNKDGSVAVVEVNEEAVGPEGAVGRVQESFDVKESSTVEGVVGGGGGEWDLDELVTSGRSEPGSTDVSVGGVGEPSDDMSALSVSLHVTDDGISNSDIITYLVDLTGGEGGSESKWTSLGDGDKGEESNEQDDEGLHC